MKSKDKIKEYKGKNCPIIKQTKSYIVFRVRKKFNWWLFIMWLVLLNVFGVAGYITYYVTQPDWKEKTIWKNK